MSDSKELGEEYKGHIRIMNVRFVNLFRRYYKPWMNRKARSVNLSLHQALLRYSKSRVHVIDTTLFLWEKFTTHGLHLNS